MSGTRRALASVIAALAIAAALGSLKAQAVPRYSARYGQTCALCHVNPTGGGLRNSYAREKLAPQELAWSPGAPGLSEVDSLLRGHVRFGADFREVYLYETPGSTQPVPQGFFQMQGDVYLSFQLDPRFTLYFDRGMANTYELFALGYVLPWTGYLKAGRFIPPYGWKYDDHTMFVRGELGFFPPGNTDVGVEAGLSPQPLDLQIALLNGNRGSIQDDDRRTALAATALVRLPFRTPGAALGISAYHQPGRIDDLDMAGARGYAHWGLLDWVGEGDWIRHRTGGGTIEGIVTSHALTWQLRQGLDLIGTYDYYDPELDHATGATWRWGGGIHCFPRSFLALEALFRATRVDAGPAMPRRNFDEGMLQLHILY